MDVKNSLSKASYSNFQFDKSECKQVHTEIETLETLAYPYILGEFRLIRKEN